ncbi:MAG: FAD-dependent oxidoreductase [Lentisphaerae bacterium]|jgi:hypothetical protein|nr:FAD-dependent oxidoreductase [Lentisphaerota bacterium]MBT4817632.1 FAD-dependent oxidoreductase [Lentisphaerota bacterium]MBT5605376.1 FAD-dependent oxidoreductase [Lentisphaerota bacterium]MBT7060381.1 FAD-dependent oxidoreductase [Lentisphaerota bacterium]MBT7844765.1 FAD-dependent oxidoreductase [Lentisphaerota bacterium]
MTEHIRYPTQDLPLLPSRSVVVCGGGPAGCSAAIAAARQGLNVLLVEGQGQLGGMGTSGLVSHWLGGRRKDGTWVVGGIFREVSMEAAEQGIALLPVVSPGQKYTPHGWYLGLIHGVPFDPFGMAAYLDRKMASEQVDVLLHTHVVDAVRVEGRITHVILYNKGGLQAVPAQAVIDATGDADVAARFGCPFDKGRDDDGAMTPVTLEVHVDGVDQEALASYIDANDSPRFRALIADLRERGEWPLPVDILISVQLTEPGTMMLNTTRLCGYDGTDGASVTRGMVEGRAEIEALVTCLRQHVPGFSAARIKTVASLLGVRETRRIRGEYRLTVADLMRENTFPDVVGVSCYGWDLPDPKKPSHQPMHGKAKPALTPIPYRIMVPLGVDNLVCPGRAVSVERDVMGPLRVMAPCMAMGEAAGIAAGQVARDELPFCQVDTDALRTELSRHGAILDGVP